MNRNCFKDINNPNREYRIDEFSMQSNFVFELESGRIVEVGIQTIREFDVSEDEDGKFVRRIKSVIVFDNDTKEKWLFEKNKCLNKEDIPEFVKEGIKEFNSTIPTF